MKYDVIAPEKGWISAHLDSCPPLPPLTARPVSKEQEKRNFTADKAHGYIALYQSVSKPERLGCKASTWYEYSTHGCPYMFKQVCVRQLECVGNTKISLQTESEIINSCMHSPTRLLLRPQVSTNKHMTI